LGLVPGRQIVPAPGRFGAGPAVIKPIKIGDNYAYKFFYLESLSQKKWYVMLNIQVNKNQETSKSINGMIYGIPTQGMGANQNIKTVHNNNDIVLEFTPFIVLKDTQDEIVLNFDKFEKQINKIHLDYLQSDTFKKDILKETWNDTVTFNVMDLF